MKIKELYLLLFLFLSTSIYSQQLEHTLNVVDIGTSPRNVKSPYFSFTMGDKLYLITTNNGDYDLVEYDGDSIRMITSDIDGGITVEGELDNGSFLTLGSYSNTLYLYFLEKNTSTLTQLYEFEHNFKAMKTFGDFAIFIDWNDRLLVSDGTPGGTTLIKQFNDLFYAEELQNQVSDGIILRADDQVWKTDGTIAGTQPVSGFNIDSNDKYVQSGDYVYFKKSTFNPYRELLWRTDGTDSGTELITSDLDTFNSIDNFYAIDGGILFFGETDEYGKEVWTCMENQTESQLLIDIAPGTADGVVDDVFNGIEFFTEDNVIFFRGGVTSSEVWKSDGTLAGTQAIIDFTGLTGYDNFEINKDYVGRSEAGKDFFITKSDEDEKKFWSYDNATQTTIFITDIGTTFYAKSATTEDKFFFQYGSGSQIWVSDGTPNGTLEVYPNAGVNLKFLGAKNGLLFFNNQEGQPCVSDGTIAGTGLLKDIQIDNAGSVFVGFDHNLVLDYDNDCHFYAYDDINSLALYKTDGTEAGTIPVADIYPHTFGSDIENLTKNGDKLYFTINDTLWVSDGTAGNSTKLNIPFTTLNGEHYYGKTSTHLFLYYNYQLFATDGTVAGTTFLLQGQDFFGNFDFSSFENHSSTTMNDLLWFFYDNGNNGLELYRSDGTPQGTYPAFESLPNEETIFDMNNSEIVELNGKLFFENKDAVFGKELWSSDGTLAGTSIFMDINSGSSNSSPQLFKKVNGKIYFTTFASATNTYSTYVTDGTVGGTIKLADVAISSQYGIATIGNELIYCSFKDLWKTDGTPAGTILLQQNDRQPNYLTSFGDKVIFSLDDDVHGEEPWITDGTSNGTQLLKDYNPGDDADPEEFSVIQNLAFFSVDTTGFGYRKLWVYDGDSTYLSEYSAQPIRNVEDFQKIESRLYFIADNTIYGKELHYFEFDLPTFPVSGKVYHDENGNGDLDINESGILNIKIISGNGYEYTTFTNNEGDYQLFLPDGNYTIEPLFDQCWGITSDSTSYSITVTGTTISDLDFALNNIIDTPLVNVSLYSAITRCGFTVPNWLHIVNSGCDTITSIIQVELDSLVTFVDADIPPDSILNQTLIWNIGTLNASQQSLIKFNLLMPDEQSVDEIITHNVQSFRWSADTLALSDQYEYSSIINCAIDPNDKRVMPNREDLSVENYTLFEETLTYQVRFQNTGNDTAFTVRVIDTISPLLDMESFAPITASHSYVVNTYPNNIVEFLFENILLPDSTTNEPESHGFFVFEINTLEGIDEFSSINNTAHIYFDFNSAVVTNTISNTMVSTFDNDEDGYDIWNDCDDFNPNVNSNNPEILYNGLDDDCDPLTLDDDLDQDGFPLATDCDDNNPNINPGVTEIAYNGIDDDCDILTLDDDLDQDGFPLAMDCDDNNFNVNPGVAEIVYNGIDDDCDILTLDDDLDQDGFPLATDCDDNNFLVNPDSTEIVYNGIDDDCNPLTLDDDLDEDGFPFATDCDDTNADINDDAIEIPNNGIDEDCDGEDLMVSNNNLNQPAIIIYPNPTTNFIYIELPYIENAEIEILDMHGKQIQEKKFEGSTTIDFDGFASGVYYVKINTDQYSWFEKIIKMD